MMHRFSAFTLAELLIALSILGVIATFTIPKVLQSQGESQHRAVYREALGTVSGMYQSYKLKNTVTEDTRLADMTPYLNYVRMFTSGHSIDQSYNTAGTNGCSDWQPCFLLHNGAIIMSLSGNGPPASSGANFGGTSNTNYFFFKFDPDGKVTDTSATGQGKGVDVNLYYNGAIRPFAYCQEGDTMRHEGSLVDWCPIGPQIVPEYARD